MSNPQILLKARPKDRPGPEHFERVETAMPVPGRGEVLLRHRFLSLDPYMRGRMDDTASYAAPVPLGGVMEGECVAEVLESHHDGFAPGDWVRGARGWQGFEAKWVLQPSGAPPRPVPAPSRHTGFENLDYSEGIENGRIT